MRSLPISSVGAILLGCVAGAWGAEAPASEPKPRIAFFPLAGNAKEELRTRAAFALRAKLDRGGVYDVIDGYKMRDVAAESDSPVTFDTKAEAMKELGRLCDATVLVWGEFVNLDAGPTIRLKILDLREKDPAPRAIQKVVKEAMDLRFVTEEILETLPGVAKFEHPSEQAVQNDPDAEAMWKSGRNLVRNADFSDSGAWHAIYQSEKYPPPVSNQLPAVDKVCIQRVSENGAPNNVLAMNLSRYCAENNGMACLSDPIAIEENTRYRLQFRYKSDGPRLHVFVKGYTMEKDIRGQTVEREIYRRQVPPTGKTDGQWVTITDELNPQHVAFPVRILRIDLYAYLSPGVVLFDDVVLKSVGKMTRKATDEAIKKPISRPAGAK